MPNSFKNSLHFYQSLCFPLALFKVLFLAVNCQRKACWQCEAVEIVECLSFCTNCCFRYIYKISCSRAFSLCATGKFQHDFKNQLVFLFVFLIKTTKLSLALLTKMLRRDPRCVACVIPKLFQTHALGLCSNKNRH